MEAYITGKRIQGGVFREAYSGRRIQGGVFREAYSESRI